MNSTRRNEVYAFVKAELNAGRQAYVVCPRIGKEDPSVQLPVLHQDKAPFLGDPTGEAAGSEVPISATALFKEYQEIFAGYQVGLLHGRMSTKEQKSIFSAFKAEKLQVLVATQIIEVGVDVPNATMMVVEGAERFGLAQLHQLRGRVGRGKHESTCILMADPKHPASAERLQTLVEVSDAFKISEEDLRLRGPGELLGKRQSGLPDLKCLEWATQGPWLEITKTEAEALLSQDPALASPELAGLKEQVYSRFQELTEP